MHRLSVLAVLVVSLALAGATVAGPLTAPAVAQQQSPPPDSDGDGVPDSYDKCPNEAGQSQYGCPVDTDKDGVPDSADKCPGTYGPDRADGCTVPVAQASTNYGTLAHVARNGPNAVLILCDRLPSDGGGCFFDVSLRLTPASAHALGVKDRTVWRVHGEVDRYIDNGSDFGYGKFSDKRIHVAAAMKRALRGARRATFELSGTFHWGHEPVQTMKDGHGHAVSRFTKTTKLERMNGGLSTPEPARAPTRNR